MSDQVDVLCSRIGSCWTIYRSLQSGVKVGRDRSAGKNLFILGLAQSGALCFVGPLPVYLLCIQLFKLPIS